jgi:hypothetical protein
MSFQYCRPRIVRQATFPPAGASQVSAKNPVAPTPFASDLSMHEKETVLIIDDDPAHLRIYGWIMEAATQIARSNL